MSYHTHYFKPKNPAMSHFSKRLSTFDQWSYANLNKFVLADSGFYLMNNLLVCFHCALFLSPQTITNMPIEQQHLRYNPLCYYATEKMQGKKLPPSKDHHPSFEKNKPLLLCIICMVNERNVLFVPCRHFGTCKPCSEKLIQCPTCRTFIESRQKVFLN